MVIRPTSCAPTPAAASAASAASPAGARRRQAGRPTSAGHTGAGRRRGSRPSADSTPPPKCSRLVRPPPGVFRSTRSSAPSSTRDPCHVEDDLAAARPGHLRRVADESESGDIGAGVDGADRQASQRLRRTPCSIAPSRRSPSAATAASTRANLIAVAITPVPSGLVSSRRSPGGRPRWSTSAPDRLRP